MRVTAVYLAICLHLATTFGMWWPVADYLLDMQSYQEQCENKALPMLHCNGKCVLAKKIAAMSTHAPDASQAPQMAPVQDQMPFIGTTFSLVSTWKAENHRFEGTTLLHQALWFTLVSPPPEA